MKRSLQGAVAILAVGMAAPALADGGPDGPALLDATHFGTEWPWLEQAARLLVTDLAASGTTVETRVSTTVTDPWSAHQPSSGPGGTG